MKTFKKLSGLALLGAVGLGLTTATSYAESDWNFSATFSDGLVVTGSFEGTQSGNFVDIESPVSVEFDGVPMTGTPYIATWGPSGWESGAVVSFTGTDNNFVFANSDLGGGNGTYNSFFYMIPSSVAASIPAPVAYAVDSPAGLEGIDYTTTTETSWTLVDPPAGFVPDGGSTAMLCGMSLAALGWLRRKVA